MSNIITKKSKNADKKTLLTNLILAAKEYKENIVGNVFMYVFDNRYIEVNFKIENFKHLTGIESFHTPKSFFKDCIKNKLTISQFYFSSRHPFKTAKRKIYHLNNLFNMLTNECFIQESITTDYATFKFGTTNLNFSIMLGEDIDENTNIMRSSFYIPKSLRDKDCFDKSTNVYNVNYIFCKKNSEKEYSKILYFDKSFNYLPDEVFEKLNISLQNFINSNKITI